MNSSFLSFAVYSETYLSILPGAYPILQSLSDSVFPQFERMKGKLNNSPPFTLFFFLLVDAI